MVLHLPLAAISPRELCCNLDAPSGIDHMGDDEALSASELIEVICSALGKKARIWRIPRGLMNGFAKIGDVIKGSRLMVERNDYHTGLI